MRPIIATLCERATLLSPPHFDIFRGGMSRFIENEGTAEIQCTFFCQIDVEDGQLGRIVIRTINADGKTVMKNDLGTPPDLPKTAAQFMTMTPYKATLRPGQYAVQLIICGQLAASVPLEVVTRVVNN